MRIDASVPAEVLDRVTPISFTRDGLRRSPGWFEGHGLVVGDPHDVTQLMRFIKSIGITPSAYAALRRFAATVGS